jgi:hypothetical protein
MVPLEGTRTDTSLRYTFAGEGRCDRLWLKAAGSRSRRMANKQRNAE